MRKEIRFAGFGGQGIGLAGYILGKAFALYDGLEAVMTQSYGPEARGGASSANVVVSDAEIAYPFIQRPDVLIAFSQEAYARFRPDVRAGGLILIDGDLVNYRPDQWHWAVPATRMADDLGHRIVANMVMLGYFTAVTQFVTQRAIEEAITSAVKPATLELNLRAFAAGYEYADRKELAR
ncbi:MAG: 2-oxoacid:acceptor oxidoreductase family protein [Chloroflexota bacterium]|nr:MAG: 2-oxoacid:acceptor oxidoreductase family protein [Chloroflexota bacterium]